MIADKIKELDGTIYKECSLCLTWKPISNNYYKNAQGLGGYASRCKKCVNDPFSLGKNREKVRKRFEERMENKRRREILNANKRRGAFSNIPHTISAKQWKNISTRFNNSCALTGDRARLHMDHVIPLSVGHGGTVYENMIPLRADLNLSKSNRNIFDWFADNRERFGLEQRKFDELIEYLADINNMTTKEYEEYVRWCHDNPRTIDEIKAEETSDDEAS